MSTAIANTTKISREEWLELRKQGVGGSECASAARYTEGWIKDTYHTPLELYHLKRGEINQETEDKQEMFRRSHDLEPIARKWYERRTGHNVQRDNIMWRHDEYPWMLANTDGKVVGQDKGLEIKTTTGFAFNHADWGPDGSDIVPMPYLCQVQWYMEVKGYDEWDLYLFLNRDDTRLYRFERDQDFARGLIHATGLFWECVQEGSPPDPDHTHKTTSSLLKRLYPGTNGQTIELNGSVQVWRDRVKSLRKAKRRLTKVEEFYKNRIGDVMGEAAVGELERGSIKRKLIQRDGYSVDAREYMQTYIN